MKRWNVLLLTGLLLISSFSLIGSAKALLHWEDFANGVGSWNSYSSQLAVVDDAGNSVLQITDPVGTANSGAYTFLGAKRGSFSGGWSSSVDIYIDLSDPRIAAGTYGFDLSQAIANKTGTSGLQDNIFHVGAADLDSNGTNSVYVNASHNTDFTLNPSMLAADQPYGSNEDPGEFTTSGWYTFSYDFSPSTERAGFVDVRFSVTDRGGNQVWTAHWTTEHYTLADAGGNYYLWFTYVDATELDVDNVHYGYPTIQAAVDAASIGDTILVESGDYVEQAMIGKDLSLIGAPGASIASPGSTTVTIPETGSTFDPIIFVYGGAMDGSHAVSGTDVVSADVKNLDIDGQNSAPAAPTRFVGILLRNVDGEISGNTIHNMYDADGKGNGPQTIGIAVYGDSDVQILDNTISEFSRGGILASGDLGSAPDPNVLIQGNTVTGNGLESETNWWAENGIQVGYGATGQIIGNTVSDCTVNNPSWASSGIIVAGSDGVLISGNTSTGSDMGICIVGPATGNLVQYNDVSGNTYGIALQQDAVDTQIIGNVLTGNVGDAVYAYSFGGGLPLGTLLRYNAISGNSSGVSNYDTYFGSPLVSIDAALNWWGSASGPSGDGPGAGDSVWGNVIFSPWLGTNPDGDPGTPGVQLVSPMLIVVADAGPAPADGYLNAAIDAANNLPGTDTIQVLDGAFDGDEPITDGVNIVSTAGAGGTELNGPISIAAANVLLGRMGQGFTINGPITVGAGIDASTIHINWNDIFDVVTNNGDNTLDATFNYWGTDGPNTVGLVAIYPYLPEASDTILGYMGRYNLNALQAIDFSELLASLNHKVRALAGVDLMDTFGFSIDEVLELIDEYGWSHVRNALRKCNGDYDDFLALLVGYGVGGGGGGSFLGGGGGGEAGSSFSVGSSIPLEIELTHPITGEPVTDAVVSYSVCHPLADGTCEIVSFGVMTYDDGAGAYTANVDTTGFEPGTYDIYIGTDDDHSQHFQVEVTES